MVKNILRRSGLTLIRTLITADHVGSFVVISVYQPAISERSASINKAQSHAQQTGVENFTYIILENEFYNNIQPVEEYF